MTDTDTTWTSSDDAYDAGVDAHYSAYKAYQYFESTFGWKGLDGDGGPYPYDTGLDDSSSQSLTALMIGVDVKFICTGLGCDTPNGAAWTGEEILVGLGDSESDGYGSFAMLDIVGHEWTHGIIDHINDLTYSGESGALNESWADAFGTLVQNYAEGGAIDWKIGQNYFPTDPDVAIRYMDNPALAGDPDHYLERYTGTLDNGGVHTNSGIPNRAFSLLVAGGTHSNSGSMYGIGSTASAVRRRPMYGGRRLNT